MKIFKLLLIALIFSLTLGQLTRVSFLGQTVAINLTDILLFSTVLYGIFTAFVKKKKIDLPPASRFIIIFILIALASLLFSISVFSTSEIFLGSFYLWRWIVYAALYFVVFNLLQSKDKNFFLDILILSGIALSIFGFLQLLFFPDFYFMSLSGWDPHFGRLVGTFYDPNFLGGYLIIIFLLITHKILTLYSSDKSANKKAYLLAAAIIFMALALTYSRSTYLMFAVGLLSLSVLRKSFKLISLTLILCLLLGIIYLPRTNIEKQKNIQRGISAQARITSWNQGLDIFFQHPFSGIGFNNYRWIINSFDDQNLADSRPGAGNDSSLIFILTTTGIFGFIAYLLIYLRLLQFSLFTSHFSLFASVMAGLFIHSFFVNSLFYPNIMALFWILTGILNVQRNS